MTFGEKIRELRKERNWSQQELADRVCLSKSAISNYENHRRMLDEEKIKLFSRLFGYDWQKADRKETSVSLVSKQALLQGGSVLSARHYIGQRPVTLRVDIQQQIKAGAQRAAEQAGISLAELIEQALGFYLKHLPPAEGYQNVNGWIVQEKAICEVPSWIDARRQFAIYAPDGRCMEDHLLQEEAMAWCHEHPD